MGTRPLLTRAPSDLVYHDHGKNAILSSVHTAEHEWTVATINVYLFFSCHIQKDVMMHRDLCTLFDDGMIIMDQDVARPFRPQSFLDPSRHRCVDVSFASPP
jgi:hypothetical protein